MASNAPWSVKGIEPKARETAKALARRSGLTLGEWLSRRIEDEFEDTAPATGQAAEGLERLAARIEAAEQRSALAVAGVDQAVRGALARLESTEREQVSLGARFEGALQDTLDGQARLADRLIKLEERTAGSGTPEAFKALEATIGRIANQVYDADGRARDSVSDLRRDLNALTARLEGGRVGADEGALARFAERLDAAEGRTSGALRGLEESFARLEQRLAAAETRLDTGSGGGAADVEERLGAITANLAKGVEAARIEMAEQLRASADGRLSRMEEALSEMGAHVETAERRSAQAIERVGHEVLRVAEALSHKVQKVEQRSADAIERVGGEVAKAVGQLDSRIARAEGAQAQTLERLSLEITRISERLAERIGQAERRSAQAIDDVGEQVSRVTERLNQRYERSSSDLAERIRLSEERTARLLEEAKERIDRRLSDVRHRQGGLHDVGSDPLAAPAYPGAAAAEAPLYPDAAPFGQVYAPEGFAPVAQVFGPGDIEAAQSFVHPATPQSEADFVDEPALPPAAVDIHPEPAIPTVEIDEPAPFFGAPAAPETPAERPLFVAEPPPAMEEFPPLQRALSTRELIEQARAAARASAERSNGAPRQAERVSRPRDTAAFAGGGQAARRRKRRRSQTKTLLVASFAVAAVALTGGMLIYTIGGESVLPNQLAALFQRKAAPGPASVDAPPRLAVALDPQPIDDLDPIDETPPETVVEAAAAATPAAATQPNAAQLFRDGRAQVEAGRNAGVESVRRAANLGHAGAQAYLASLYKNGRGGLPKDMAQARRWYERAASGGDRTAMHETALLQFNGEGGPKNLTSAATWFRRAADLGSTDSQYNLGILYEEGLGVGKNPAEAYKWYLLAARDTNPEKRAEARTAADRMRGLIGPEAQAAAERIVGGYTPAPANASAQAGPVVIDVADTQRALTRLGFYRGPVDGMMSTDLRASLQAFQRDQGMAGTGNLDSATAEKLSLATR